MINDADEVFLTSFSCLPKHCSRCCYSFSVSEIGANPRWVPFKSSNFLFCSSKPKNLSRSLCLSSQNGGFRENSGEVGCGDAVIIVDHGSRRKESNLMLNEFVEMFKHKTGYEIVEPAHMELAEPSIRDAFQSCVQQGAHRIIINPFFLSPGRHWSQDIPSLSAEAAKEHPDVSYIVTAPLGLHELLVDVVNGRIKHCLKHVAGDADECSVCAGTGKCRLY
ncbi:Sirohydrochlorin ferrochelatase [Spatholobus suberectus]|nr:Sirohydrochlorin ferrochelatase [Spatholobus suberectus]